MDIKTEDRKFAGRDNDSNAGKSLQDAEQAAGDAKDKAKDAASSVGQNVADAAAYVGHKAEDATSSVGNALENTGQYLKNDGLRHIADDLTEMIKRNPVPAMLLGIGLGFLFAQASSRRSA